MKALPVALLGTSLMTAGVFAQDEPAADSPAPATHVPATHATAPAGITAEQALQALKDGNARFITESPTRPRQDVDRRCDTFGNGQHPIASILSCADSRVPVELVFDQGIGDLFVIRVAGNVADTDEVGTIEYGVGHLRTPLVVVLGHTRCGAVTAVVEGAHVGPNIERLVDNIKPAAAAARATQPALSGAPLVSAAITQNVWQSISDLIHTSPETAGLMREGKVQVVGAMYDLHSGGVHWLGRHPREAELLSDAPASPDAAHAPQNPPAAQHAPSHVAPSPSVPAHNDVPAPTHPAPDAHAPSDPHGALTPTTAPTHEAAGHNYIALSICLAGSGALSALVLKFLKNHRDPAASHETPASDMHAEEPAA